MVRQLVDALIVVHALGRALVVDTHYRWPYSAKVALIKWRREVWAVLKNKAGRLTPTVNCGRRTVHPGNRRWLTTSESPTHNLRQRQSQSHQETTRGKRSIPSANELAIYHAVHRYTARTANQSPFLIFIKQDRYQNQECKACVRDC